MREPGQRDGALGWKGKRSSGRCLRRKRGILFGFEEAYFDIEIGQEAGWSGRGGSQVLTEAGIATFERQECRARDFTSNMNALIESQECKGMLGKSSRSAGLFQRSLERCIRHSFGKRRCLLNSKAWTAELLELAKGAVIKVLGKIQEADKSS